MDEVGVVVDASIESRDNAGVLLNKNIFQGLTQIRPQPISEVTSLHRVDIFDSFSADSSVYFGTVFRSIDVGYDMNIGDKYLYCDNANQRIILDFGSEFDFSDSPLKPKSCSDLLPVKMVVVGRFVIFYLTGPLASSKIDLCVDIIEKNSGGMSNLGTQFDTDYASGTRFDYLVRVSLVYKSLVLTRLLYNLNSYFYQSKEYTPPPTLAKEASQSNPRPSALFKLTSPQAPLNFIPKAFVYGHRFARPNLLKMNSNGLVSFVFESHNVVRSSEVLVLKLVDVLDNTQEVLKTTGSVIQSALLPVGGSISSERLQYKCIIEAVASAFEKHLSEFCEYNTSSREFWIQVGISGSVLPKKTKYRVTIASDSLHKHQLIFTKSRWMSNSRPVTGQLGQTKCGHQARIRNLIFQSQFGG